MGKVLSLPTKMSSLQHDISEKGRKNTGAQATAWSKLLPRPASCPGELVVAGFALLQLLPQAAVSRPDINYLVFFSRSHSELLPPPDLRERVAKATTQLKYCPRDGIFHNFKASKRFWTMQIKFVDPWSMRFWNYEMMRQANVSSSFLTY